MYKLFIPTENRAFLKILYFYMNNKITEYVEKNVILIMDLDIQSCQQ